MAYSETLAETVRQELIDAGAEDIREVKMYGGLAFMVRDKMCVCVSGMRDDMVMIRIGKERYQDALKKPGASEVIMKNRPVRGYIDLDKVGQRDLRAWIAEALEFNAELTSES